MPDHDRMAVFRRRIEAMLAALDGEDAKGRDGQRTVTLDRIDSGEFGYCVDCGEDIAEERLTLDPGITLCISCARG